MVAGILCMISILIVCSRDKTVAGNTENDPSGRYIDGVYEGQSDIDWEGYRTTTAIQVTGGKIRIVDWQIYDNYRKRYFDETYETVYTGNTLYIQQCRDNMVGMRTFGPKLIETQDVDLVDNITGATWCHRKFREVVKIALADACTDTSGSIE